MLQFVVSSNLDTFCWKIQFFSSSSPTCMAAATARYPYGYYPYSQEQVQVQLTLFESIIFIHSELFHRLEICWTWLKYMLHLHCLLESIVPLSRFMIIQYYTILHLSIYINIYIYYCTVYMVSHAACVPPRIASVSVVLNIGVAAPDAIGRQNAWAMHLQYYQQALQVPQSAPVPGGFHQKSSKVWGNHW